MAAQRRYSIRARLLALALLPLVLVLPLLGLVLLVWGNDALDRLLITKVRSDLAVAQGYFERVQAEVGGGTRAAAGSHALVQPLQQGRLDGVPALLAAARAEHGLEFLNLLAPDGRLLARETGLVADGPAMPLLVADASGALASVAVIEAARFAEIAPQLSPRLGIPLLPTQNAAPTQRAREDRALVLVARAPVLDEAGRLLGHLQGGVLLNRNLGFIDHLNQIVYPEGALPAGSLGTATLFLDDVRVSTNVRLFGGSEDRAIGTRVSREVRDAVLGRGGTWLARAFVVNDWYVSAYEPLADGGGQRVGMLYVGFLERPFVRIKTAVLAGIAIVFFAVMALAAWVSLRWARTIFKPLERMTRTMGRVEAGEGAARVGPLAGRPDELTALAGHLDHLLDTVDDKTRALQRWGEELDHKVAERTAELEAAQARLLRSEKLATVGQLTASIAHEVNNPIAVIQGNLDLARELLGAAAAPAAAELRLIDQQVERMRLIVTQLLQYARPGDYAGYVEPVDVPQLLQDCLVLLARPLQAGGVTVQQQLHSGRAAAINRQELQQVLINLIANAQQAMPDGGLLTAALDDWDDANGRPLGLRLRLQDSGPGVPAALRERLFQPFVTGRRDGTGLGLWISRSLVERYGGELKLQPSETGACFELLLRSEAR
ncbi:cache domain-containing protein [Roseateles saccharophilus]|uniref:histidine kinase n=1 Tax=Roseateles saccharophilus TaxID=304 RepID=A0A4R3UER9_ROSSA|nr:cache domain-containing protein [Roseateles saccharophilus]MDG0835568.1 HAMP domain-containing protein [Roseateles saccharophilus]TCU85482.1 HAMP domain-containing protein [Roseateles saccharophilus]